MPRHTPAERKKKKKRGIVANVAARSAALAELGVAGTFKTAEQIAGEKFRSGDKEKKKNGSSHRSGHKSLHESPFK